MLADSAGTMPSSLLIEADQQFLSDGLDRASVIVHGRNSHENQPQSPQRRRLIATRGTETIAPAREYPHALLWNPAGLSLEEAAGLLGVRDGMAAILGGTEIFGFFLPRYHEFHLSQVAGLRLPFGRPVFPQVPQRRPEAVLALNGLASGPQRKLDVSRGVTLSTWQRESRSSLLENCA